VQKYNETADSEKIAKGMINISSIMDMVANVKLSVKQFEDNFKLAQEHKKNQTVAAIGKFPDMIEYDNLITITKEHRPFLENLLKVACNEDKYGKAISLMISFAKSFTPDEPVRVDQQMEENIIKIYAKASNQRHKEIIEQSATRANVILKLN
jgi:hypothetical protein